MQTLLLTLQPHTAFGTPLLGDTLFGQLCWALRNRHGETRLQSLLAGYTEGQPFAVVGDASPQGFVLKPQLPANWLPVITDPTQRKAAKRQRWLPVTALGQGTLQHAMTQAQTDQQVAQLLTGQDGSLQQQRTQPHNSINRHTGTTGKGDFAPYTTEQLWHAPGLAYQLTIVLDETRLTLAELRQACDDIGAFGFGRDASIGLGKFSVLDLVEWQPGTPANANANANAWLSLGPCNPAGQGLDSRFCFYQPFTRFGRHGDIGALTGQPFKQPVLLIRGSAVLTPQHFSLQPFIGRGLGGNGELSHAPGLHATVHQGYAPLLPVNLAITQEQAA